MLPDDIHHAYLVVHKDGKEHLHPAGRLLAHKGQMHVLEDYHNGALSSHVPAGMIDDLTVHQLHNPPDNIRIGSSSAIRDGWRDDMIPEAQLKPLPEDKPLPQKNHVAARPAKPSVWHYQRTGHDKPHVVEVQGQKVLLDGNPLEHDEAATILANVKAGLGSIRYPKSVGKSISKMERLIATLRKDERLDPQDALAHLDALGQDEKTKAAVAALRQHIFEDPMVPAVDEKPGLGNKFAWQQFSAKKQPGAYVSLDGNNFRDINNTFGHETGDAAISALGGAVRDAAHETGDGKAFRSGGDEMTVHFPSHEHAANFARTLRSKLEGIPHIGGTHRLSMSMGIGPDYKSADKSLYEAKKGKLGFTHATMPHVLAHSSMPGQEGPVPTTNAQAMAPALKAPAPEQRATPPATPDATKLPKAG